MPDIFREVPADWMVPGYYAEFDLTAGNVGLATASDMILILAPMSSSGTASENQIDEIDSTGKSRILYGAKSLAHCMVRSALTANNRARIFCVGIEDSGVKAVKTITFTASSAKAGTLEFYIGFRRVQLSVADGSSASSIAAIAANFINGDEYIPFTAVAEAGVVTLTAVNGGVPCHTTKITLILAPSGVTMATATVTAGSGEPDLTGLLSRLEQEPFTLLVHPWPTSSMMNDVKAHIDLVSDALRQRGRGQVTAAGDGDVTASPSDITAVKSLASSVNHYRSTLAYLRGSKSPSFEIAAAYGAVLAKQPRPGDTVNEYVLSGIDVPAVADRLLETEKQSLLNYATGGCVTPLGVLGTSVVITKAVVTYYQSPDGSVVKKLPSWNTYRALDYVRLNIVKMERERYGNAKNDAETRDALRSDIFAVLLRLEKPDMQIVQDVEENKALITVTEDGTNPGRANASIPANVVPGMDIVANIIRLL